MKKKTKKPTFPSVKGAMEIRKMHAELRNRPLGKELVAFLEELNAKQAGSGGGHSSSGTSEPLAAKGEKD